MTSKVSVGLTLNKLCSEKCMLNVPLQLQVPTLVYEVQGDGLMGSQGLVLPVGHQNEINNGLWGSKYDFI